jgi:hypothetical protein
MLRSLILLLALAACGCAILDPSAPPARDSVSAQLPPSARVYACPKRTAMRERGGFMICERN